MGITSVPLQDIGALTNSGGTGVLDVLLKTTRSQLAIEYDKQRITGADYAQVFTSSLQSTLQVACNYLLDSYKSQYEIANLNSDNEIKQQQIDILKQKLPFELDALSEGVRQQKYITDNQLPAGVKQTLQQVENMIAEKSNIVKQGDILSVQTDEEKFKLDKLMPSELALSQSNLERSKAEISKVPFEIDEIKAKTKQTDAQTDAIIKNSGKISHEINLLDAQVTQAGKQNELTDTQISKSKFEVDELLPQELLSSKAKVKSIEASTVQVEAQTNTINANLAKVPLELDVLSAQVDQSKKQVEVLDQNIKESNFKIDKMLPQELLNAEAQVRAIESNITQTGTQTKLIETNIAKAPYEISVLQNQVKQGDKQNELLSQNIKESQFKLDEMLPQELLNSKAQVKSLEAQVSRTNAETAKVASELGMLDAQQKAVIAETKLTETKDVQLTAELAKTPVEIEIMRKQLTKADNDIELVRSQVELTQLNATKVPDEIVILRSQNKQVQAQTSQVNAQTESVLKTTATKLPLENKLLEKQLENSDASIKLIESQVRLSTANEAKVPNEIEYIQAQIANMAKNSMLLEREYDIKLEQLKQQQAQLELTKSEVDIRKQELENKKSELKSLESQSALYAQKVITEKAQTDGNVIGTNSVLGYNNQVLQGQIKAYDFDSKNRVLKLMIDSFTATYGDGSRTANAQNKLTDVDIGKVMQLNIDAISK